MSAHQRAISRLYTEKVARNPSYPEKGKQRFDATMTDEYARSDPDGPNMAA